MAGAYDSDKSYELSSVISRGFETVSSHFGLFMGLAIIFSGLPQFILQWWMLSNTAGAPQPSLFFTPAFWLTMTIGWVVAVVSGAILQVTLTRATVLHLSGEPVSFGACLAAGFSMILPIIGLSILMALGVGLGFLLLVVPGILLWLAWSVTVPVYVQEKVGVIEAFGRSAALTKGSRWGIFLTMLILLVAAWLIMIPLGMIKTTTAAATGNIVLVAMVQGLFSSFTTMVMVAIQASIYVELRDKREGVAPADLETIFA